MPAPLEPTSGAFRTRVRQHYDEQVDTTHKALMFSWIAFGVTFGLVRFITYGIRDEWLPINNIETGGLHIHHFVWGIGLLMLVGFLGIVDDRGRHNKALGVMYGIAAALVVDEFALLLNLEDVYWARQGRWSVDIALVILAVLGIYVTGRHFWHMLAREVTPKRWHARPTTMSLKRKEHHES